MLTERITAANEVKLTFRAKLLMNVLVCLPKIAICLSLLWLGCQRWGRSKGQRLEKKRGSGRVVLRERGERAREKKKITLDNIRAKCCPASLLVKCRSKNNLSGETIRAKRFYAKRPDSNLQNAGLPRDDLLLFLQTCIHC